MNRILKIFPWVLLLSPPCWACSGPGAPVLIAQSIRLGYIAAAVTALFLAIGIAIPYRRGRRGIVLYWPLLVLFLHPAWTVSARSGDCGRTKVEVSIVFAVFALVLLTLRFFKCPKKSLE